MRAGLQAFVQAHRPDELLLTANVFDHAARLRSFELAMGAFSQSAGSSRSGAAHADR